MSKHSKQQKNTDSSSATIDTKNPGQRNAGQANRPSERGQSAPSRPEKSSNQTAKEQKNKNEAPSREDWEGGGSRPSNESRGNKQGNTQEGRNVRADKGFESEEEDVKEEREI